MLLCLWPGFGDVFLNPNGYLFANSGDGLKNYFNFGYYLKYDTGFKFSAINYPYGDHLLFTDTHPLLAYLLNLVDDHLFELAPNSAGIINLAILLGVVAGALVLYLILRHYSLPVWYSVIIAVCVTLLSPQWDRIHGHLSLSYVFIIPLFWYLVIRYEQGRSRILYWCLLFFYTLIVGGIHIYYVAICAAFMLAYVFVNLVRNKDRRSVYLTLSLSVILPLALYQTITIATDFIPDRPDSPYGFYTYYATLASVFLPHISSSADVVNHILQPNLSWEGRAFVGTPALIFIIGLIVFYAQRLRQKVVGAQVEIPTSLSAIFWASGIVLLFSMCIPFKWGLQFLTELIPPLKQFRALGRFSWIFFYVVNVSAAWTFFHLFNQLRKSAPGWYSVV
ncbi:MAG: hypothetical protein HKN76_21190, partial [Saprospiraceae bacterium]|nr:hypothetical protein [Saprospiraceae bacterium]